MKTTICWYSGTGNSFWVAKTLAAELGGAELLSINHERRRAGEVGGDAIGLVFPVHIWGVPGGVLDFVNELRLETPAYLFAVAVNAGQVANTLVQLDAVLKGRGAALSGGFDIPMPSNYIPWGGPGPIEQQRRRFDAAREKIVRIAAQIRKRGVTPVEKGPLWQHLLFTPLNRLSFGRIGSMDGKFVADERCTRCGICQRICPAGNITLADGIPVWNHRCEQCFACLQWCPAEAIQYGARTSRFKRYHHPEVALKELLGPR
jgi:ferredoxin